MPGLYGYDNDYSFVTGFTASELKIAAIVTMLIDHFFAFPFMLIMEHSGKLQDAVFQLIYSLGRGVGRIAFILFAFMIAQGMKHTGSRKRYLRNLLILAIAAQLPKNLCDSGQLWGTDGLNVIFTYILGALAIITIEWLTSGRDLTDENASGKAGGIRRGLAIPAAAIVFAAFAFFLKTEFGGGGVLLIICFYLSKNYRQRLLSFGFYLITYCILSYFGAYGLDMGLYGIAEYSLRVFDSNWMGIFALYFIGGYNGEKGRRLNKWLCYSIYPLQFLFFYLIDLIVAGLMA